MADYLLERWKERAALIPQDVWSKSREEFPYFDEILKHDFNDMVVVFGINHVYNSNETDIKYEIFSQEYDHLLLGDYTLKDNVNIAKEIVGNIINHYALPDTASLPRDERIDGYLGQQVELHNEVMSEKLKHDPEKFLDWDKNLGKQSEYIKKAIEPFLTWKFAYTKEIMTSDNYNKNYDYKQFWITKDLEDYKFVKEHILKNFSVGDLYDYLSGYGNDEKPAVEKLKSIGIEGEIYNNTHLTVFDDEENLRLQKLKEYHDSLIVKEDDPRLIDLPPHLDKNKLIGTYGSYRDEEKEQIEIAQKTGPDAIPVNQQSNEKENIMSDKYDEYKMSEWGDAKNLRGINDDIDGHYLLTDFGISEFKENMYILVVEPSSKTNNSYLLGYYDKQHINDYKPFICTDLNVDVNTLKKMVEKTVEHLANTKDFKEKNIEDHIKQQVSDRHIETAQKTGYVQGVCESVLAFNNDENRKIMSEATMTFLSKKLLSEMNVTKDMAQKFANPETYKALEQSVFAPKQEQQLEQTQSQGRGF